MTNGAPEKIVILGAGPAGLSTAFELTNYPGWEQYYNITMYSLGWRLGGKCASGRGPNGRIQEHGIHMFLGFYQNAIKMVRDAYTEQTGDPNAWENAFVRHNSVLIKENIKGEWLDWLIKFPTNKLVPGDGVIPGMMENIKTMIAFMIDCFNLSFSAGSNPAEEAAPAEKPVLSSLQAASAPKSFTEEVKADLHKTHEWLSGVFKHIEKDVTHVGAEVESSFLEFIKKMLDTIDGELEHTIIGHIIQLLDDFLKWLMGKVAHLLEESNTLRRMLTMLELGIVNLKGLLTDVLQPDGTFDFYAINKYEYREWLTKHGASPLSLWSAPLRDIYTLVFAYPKGDTSLPGNLEAGTALKGAMSIVLDYCGSVMWEFYSSTGEAIILPIYQVLKKRGVKIKFFSKVENIGVSADGKSISNISIGRQVDLANGTDDYNPIVMVGGKECWPAKPDYNQIAPVQREQLIAKNIDLESWWADWQNVGQTQLLAGKDFDKVVLGISVGAFPYVCKELINANALWATMVNELQTVQTQGVQLWFNKTMQELGNPWVGEITDTYADQIDSWCDFTHLIAQENWPADNMPKSLSYFCGPMIEDEHIPPFTNHGFPKAQKDKVKTMTMQWLSDNGAILFPGIKLPNNPNGIDFEAFVDPLYPSQVFEDSAVAGDALPVDPAGGTIPAETATNLQRFYRQFFRANIDPTERYVLSVKGSSKTRIDPGNTGFSNLYVCGDWTLCYYNAGMVESCSVSGILATTAIRSTFGLPTNPVIGMNKK